MTWVKIKLKSGKTIEVEKELHTERDLLSKIIIPVGCRLMKFEEFMEILNYHKEKFAFGEGEWDFDEVVAFPLINLNRKYWNLYGWFAGLVGGVDWYLRVGRVRGVRFVRDVKVKRKKK